jgi:hypothetical protein
VNIRFEGVLGNISELGLKEVVRVGINLREPSWEVTTEPTPSGRLHRVSSKHKGGRGFNRNCIGPFGPPHDVALGYACVRGRFPDMFRYEGIHHTSSDEHLKMQSNLTNKHLWGVPVLEAGARILTLASQTVFPLNLGDT